MTPALAARRRRLTQLAEAGQPALDSPGQMIWWCRHKAGLSQRELEVKSGVGHGSLCEWETEKHQPKAADWIAVMEACGYRVVLEAIE